jgi:hypothetical protein
MVRRHGARPAFRAGVWGNSGSPPYQGGDRGGRRRRKTTPPSLPLARLVLSVSEGGGICPTPLRSLPEQPLHEPDSVHEEDPKNDAQRPYAELD